MSAIRSLQLPNRPLSDRELEKLREAVESGDLEVDSAFSRVLEGYLAEVQTQAHGAAVVRATSYFTASYATAVAVGVSFVPVSDASHAAIASNLTAKLKTARLNELIKSLQLNDVRVDML